MKAVALALACLLTVAAAAWAQPAAPNPLPEPYSKDEFPDWALSLRRLEIVSLGSLPIALFYTRLVFDFSRYTQNGFNPSYAPWPFKNEYSYRPSAQEQRDVFLSAALVSLSVGLIDAIIVNAKQARIED
jgi:hypothetical protein